MVNLEILKIFGILTIVFGGILLSLFMIIYYIYKLNDIKKILKNKYPKIFAELTKSSSKIERRIYLFRSSFLSDSEKLPMELQKM